MNPVNDHNDLYEIYVLGLLEEPERGRIEEDLRRNDPAARALLRRALETNAILGTLAPEAAPSKHLRRRVLSIAEPRASRLSWNLAWVALSACLVAGAGRAVSGGESAGVGSRPRVCDVGGAEGGRAAADGLVQAVGGWERDPFAGGGRKPG